VRRGERIPLHDHSDFNSGGVVAASTIVAASGGAGSDGGGGGGATVDDVVSAGVFLRNRYGGQDVVYEVAAAGTATTLDLADGNVFKVTLTAGTCTVTFDGAVTGTDASWVVDYIQDGTGNRTVAYAQTVTWADGAPTLGTAANTQTSVVFRTDDAFTTIFGYPVGGASGVAGGTPALTLGTANSAGSAATAVLTDATIAVFSDSAYPVTTTERTKSTGDDAFAARRDHVHGGGALLIADTHSTPIVFADVITNEATDDFLYSDA
jgi:hypothetical protein